MKNICILALFLASASVFAEKPLIFPFASVKFEQDRIVATLPESPIWTVSINSSPERQSKPRESFILYKDSTLSISEKHSSYSFRPKFSPNPGLDTQATIDKRSLGGEVLRKSFFILAQQAEQGAAANP